MKSLIAALLAAALLSATAFGQWVRRADVQGDITDVVVASWDGSSGDIYVSTRGSGVWGSVDGNCWRELNDGLADLEIVALAARPGYPKWLKAATASGMVFASTDGGATWIANSGALDATSAAFMINDLAIVDDAKSGQTLTYVATTGLGVLRQSTWSGSWSTYDSGITNLDIVSIAATGGGTNGHQAIAGSRYRAGGANPSALFVLIDPADNAWQTATLSPSPGNVTFWSVAFHDPTLAVVALSKDTAGQAHGLYVTQALGTTWTPVCANPPAASLLAVDYVKIGGAYTLAAGTGLGLWKVDSPLACAGVAYEPFVNYEGFVRAIGIADGNSGWLGGPGKGPARFQPAVPSAAVPVVRCDLFDTSALDIVPSPAFEIDDTTVYAASGGAGAYKNVDRIDACGGEVGYFYRMIGATDDWGTVATNTVKPVPGYIERACVPRRGVWAATDGKGVLRSDDGGRSWFEMNGANGVLDDAFVTDLVFHPGFDGDTNQTVYAAVWGKGVYRTTDGGANWNLLASGLANTRVLSLAIAIDPNDSTKLYLFVGCRSFNVAGAQYGLYRYQSNESWAALASSYLLSVARVRVDPAYATQPNIVLGTEAGGVYVSSNGGTSFSPQNTGLPGGAKRVLDLELSPDFSNDRTVLIALAATPGVSYPYIGVIPAPTWTRLHQGLPSPQVVSVAFSPRFRDAGGAILAGHAHAGVLASSADPGGLWCEWQPGGGFFDVPPNILGIAPVADDPSTVFAISRNDGAFVSRDGGDTFRPWGGRLIDGSTPACPVAESLSIAVTEELGYNYLVKQTFSGTFPPTGWTIQNGGGPCTGTWTNTNPGARTIPAPLAAPVAILDSDNQGNGCTQDDWLISPSLTTTGARQLELRFDHQFTWYDYGLVEHGYVQVRSSATGGAWVVVADFAEQFFGPESIAIDLTAYRGTAFQVAFHYVGAWDYWWMIDNVRVIEPVHRVYVGTVGNGLHWADYNDETYFGTFTVSNVASGDVDEIRYLGLFEDARAAHSTLGDLHSSNYGSTWSTLPGLPAGLGLRDVSLGSAPFLRRGDGASPWGLNSFIWGVSSGASINAAYQKSGSCTNTGAAWKYDPGVGSWAKCSTTGLDVCGDYRSVLELASNQLLIGSVGVGGGSTWRAAYRSDGTCAAWTPSDEGLPGRAMVWAFYQNASPLDRFVLAAVQDGYLTDGDGGGIYYSDASSEGRAWAKTTLPAASPGSYELRGTSDGTTVYAGLTGDGLFSSLPASISVQKPAAWFEASASNFCLGSSPTVTFTDYSAGKVLSRLWDFGDGSWCQTGSATNPCVPSDVAPQHTYSALATEKTVTLTVTNGYVASPNDSFAATLSVDTELDMPSSLRVTKGPGAGEVTLSWPDIGKGETGYQVWASNSAPSGVAVGAPLGGDVTSATLSGYSFFRVQILSTTHICGNGPVGGNW